MLGSPAPEMSHSLAGLPARQFSATIAIRRRAAAAVPPPVVKDHETLAASALPASVLDARIGRAAAHRRGVGREAASARWASASRCSVAAS